MKYYSKDYANCIISDEKEKQIEMDQVRWKKEVLESYQKRLVKHGTLYVLLWAVISIFYLFAAIYYLKTSHDPILTILYPLLCVLAAICAVINYYTVRKARAEAWKKQGATGT